MLYLITLALANLLRTTITVGELIVWTLLVVISAFGVHFVFGDGSPLEWIRLKVYIFTCMNFVVWLLFMIVIGGMGTPNDIKEKGDKDEQGN